MIKVSLLAWRACAAALRPGGGRGEGAGPALRSPLVHLPAPLPAPHSSPVPALPPPPRPPSCPMRQGGGPPGGRLRRRPPRPGRRRGRQARREKIGRAAGRSRPIVLLTTRSDALPCPGALLGGGRALPKSSRQTSSTTCRRRHPPTARNPTPPGPRGSFAASGLAPAPPLRGPPAFEPAALERGAEHVGQVAPFHERRVHALKVDLARDPPHGKQAEAVQQDPQVAARAALVHAQQQRKQPP